MVRYKHGKGQNGYNQQRKKRGSGRARGLGRNSGTQARIRNARTQDERKK